MPKMSKYAEKYAHFAKICEKCGKVPNMRQSHIRVFLTCLARPPPVPFKTKSCRLSLIIVVLLQVHGRSDSPGPEFCPHIEHISSDLSEVMVASSTEVNVTVVVKHLQVSEFCFTVILDGTVNYRVTR